MQIAVTTSNCDTTNSPPSTSASSTSPFHDPTVDHIYRPSFGAHSWFLRRAIVRLTLRAIWSRLQRHLITFTPPPDLPPNGGPQYSSWIPHRHRHFFITRPSSAREGALTRLRIRPSVRLSGQARKSDPTKIASYWEPVVDRGLSANPRNAVARLATCVRSLLGWTASLNSTFPCLSGHLQPPRNSSLCHWIVGCQRRQGYILGCRT